MVPGERRLPRGYGNAVAGAPGLRSGQTQSKLQRSSSRRLHGAGQGVGVRGGPRRARSAVPLVYVDEFIVAPDAKGGSCATALRKRVMPAFPRRRRLGVPAAKLPTWPRRLARLKAGKPAGLILSTAKPRKRRLTFAPPPPCAPSHDLKKPSASSPDRIKGRSAPGGARTSRNGFRSPSQAKPLPPDPRPLSPFRSSEESLVRWGFQGIGNTKRCAVGSQVERALGI